MKLAGAERSDGCRMFAAEQRRYFAKHRAGLRCRGHLDAISYYLNRTLDQKKEQIGLLALLHDHLPWVIAPHFAATYKFQDRRHVNLIENCAVLVPMQTVTISRPDRARLRPSRGA